MTKGKDKGANQKPFLEPAGSKRRLGEWIKGVIPVYSETESQQIARTGIIGVGRLTKDRR